MHQSLLPAEAIRERAQENAGRAISLVKTVMQ